MSNFATLIDEARTRTEDELAGWLQKLGLTVNNSEHDAPDQYGAVQARQMRPGRHESRLRWITQDVVNTLPAGPTKDFAQQQIDIVDGWYNIDQNTKEWAAHDVHGKVVPGVMAACSKNKRTGDPVYPTLAALVAAINPLPDDFTGDGAGFLGN